MLIITYISAHLLLKKYFSDSFNVEKKELVNEIVSLKKQVERYELDQARQKSQTERTKFDFDSCLLALSGSKSQIQNLQNKVNDSLNTSGNKIFLFCFKY